MKPFWRDFYPEGVSPTIDNTQFSSVTQFLNHYFEQNANLEFCTNMDVTYTYKQIDDTAKAISAWLQSKGIKKGATIAIMMPNLNQYFPTFMGIMRAGYVITSVNPLYTARELKHQLKDSDAQAIVILDMFCETLEKCIEDTNVKTVVISKIGDMLGKKGGLVNFAAKYVKKAVPAHGIKSNKQYQVHQLKNVISDGKNMSYTPAEQSMDDLAFLQYTGGTTGVSKGVKISHLNVITAATQFNTWFTPGYAKIPKGEHPNVILALPLYHLFALVVVILGLQSGQHYTLVTNPRDFDGFVKILGKRPFHIFPGVNTLYQALLDNPGFHKLDFSSLAISMAGGMAATPATAKKWLDTTGCPMVEGWGMSETMGAGTLNPIANTEFTGNVGMPLSSIDISIRDEDGKELGIDEVGEICIKGDNVTKGYLNIDNSKYFTEDGYLKTGDVGSINERGYVKLYDRKKDMLIVGGFNVFPNEVEAVIGLHPKVSECGVVGMPDERSGETVKAFVVRNDSSLTEDEVIEFARENMTGYKRPRQVVFIDELPKSNVGKILRNKLREM